MRVESESDLIEPRGTWLALIAGRMKDTLGQGGSPFTFCDHDDHDNNDHNVDNEEVESIVLVKLAFIV